MANVYIEARPKGRSEGIHIEDYVVEDRADHILTTCNSQREAIDWAQRQGHSPPRGPGPAFERQGQAGLLAVGELMPGKRVQFDDETWNALDRLDGRFLVESFNAAKEDGWRAFDVVGGPCFSAWWVERFFSWIAPFLFEFRFVLVKSFNLPGGFINASETDE
jgi:hypothetical protein